MLLKRDHLISSFDYAIMSTAKLDSHPDTSLEYPTTDETEDDSPKNDRSFRNREADCEAKAETERHNQAVNLQTDHIPSPQKKFQLGLPLEILHIIVEFLSDSYEPKGIRMATIVVQDLLNAALSCPDFLAALPYGYSYLAGKVTPRRLLPPSYDFDAMLCDPYSRSLDQLYHALLLLGIDYSYHKHIDRKSSIYLILTLISMQP